MNENISNDLPQIAMIVVSVVLVYWYFGQKTTFNYLTMILISIIFFRRNEIKKLFVDDLVAIFKEE